MAKRRSITLPRLLPHMVQLAEQLAAIKVGFSDETLVALKDITEAAIGEEAVRIANIQDAGERAKEIKVVLGQSIQIANDAQCIGDIVVSFHQDLLRAHRRLDAVYESEEAAEKRRRKAGEN